MTPSGRRQEFHRRPLPRQGHLTDYSIPELVHTLNCEETSGTITVCRDSVEKLIFVHQGTPAFVESDLRSETLGAFLVKSNRLSNDDHRLVIERMRQTGRRQGELLLEAGLLSPHELFQVMLEHVKEKIIACFAWDDGEFTFLPGDQWASNILNLKIEPSRLVLDGVLRHFTRDRLGPVESLPGDACVYLRPDAPPRTADLQLNTAEARIYELAGQGRLLQEFESRSGHSTNEVLRTLFGLYILEIVGFESGGVAQRDPLPRHTPVPGKYVEQEEVAPVEAQTQAILSDYLRLKDADHFTLLGVPREAKPAEVHEAFRRLSKLYTPKAVDNLPADAAEKAAELYSKLLAAYKELANPFSQRKYIQRLDGVSPSTDPPTLVEQQPAPASPERPRDSTIRALDAEEMFERARELLAADEYEDAISSLRDAMKMKDGEPLYEAWLGWALFQSAPDKRRRQAERHLEMARRSAPTMAEPYLFMARICEHENDTNHAAELYRVAQANARGNLEVAREANLGIIRSKKGRSRKINSASKSSKPAVSSKTDDAPVTAEKPDSALNMDVGELIRSLFSKDK